MKFEYCPSSDRTHTLSISKTNMVDQIRLFGFDIAGPPIWREILLCSAFSSAVHYAEMKPGLI
jgi:hypothetical protein